MLELTFSGERTFVKNNSRLEKQRGNPCRRACSYPLCCAHFYRLLDRPKGLGSLPFRVYPLFSEIFTIQYHNTTVRRRCQSFPLRRHLRRFSSTSGCSARHPSLLVLSRSLQTVSRFLDTSSLSPSFLTVSHRVALLSEIMRKTSIFYR